MTAYYIYTRESTAGQKAEQQAAYLAERYKNPFSWFLGNSYIEGNRSFYWGFDPAVE